VKSSSLQLSIGHLINERYIIAQRGKKNYYLLKLAE